GSQRETVLHPETAVDLHVATVVDPGDPEDDRPLRFHHPFKKAVLGVFGVQFDERPDAFDDFGDSLQELDFARVALGDVCKKSVCGLIRSGHRYSGGGLNSCCTATSAAVNNLSVQIKTGPEGPVICCEVC